MFLGRYRRGRTDIKLVVYYAVHYLAKNCRTAVFRRKLDIDNRNRVFSERRGVGFFCLSRDDGIKKIMLIAPSSGCCGQIAANFLTCTYRTRNQHRTQLFGQDSLTG